METRTAAGFRERLRARVARFEPGDRDEVVAFRREMYGERSIFADPAYLEWESRRADVRPNPFWVYRDDGRIAGTQCGSRVEVRIGGERHRALWTFDLMIRPDCRLRGAGTVLAEAAFEDTPLTLGLEVSKEARRANLRAGWVDLGTVPLWFRPLDGTVLLRDRWHVPFARVVGGPANAILRGVELLGRATAGGWGLELTPIADFDERADGLWESVSPHYPVICRRDRAWLSWRFAHFPKPRYHCFYLSRGGMTVGYAVLRLGRRHGQRAGYLVDYLCAPKWTRALVARVLEWFRARGAVAAYALHLDPSGCAAFKASGFVRRDSAWPLMVRAGGLSKAAFGMVSDPRRWFLTAGDADVDRPRTGTVFAPSSVWKEP